MISPQKATLIVNKKIVHPSLLGKLIPCTSFPHRKEHGFLRSLRPHLSHVGARTQEGFIITAL